MKTINFILFAISLIVDSKAQELLERSDDLGIINGVAWEAQAYQGFGARIDDGENIRLIVASIDDRKGWMVVFRANSVVKSALEAKITHVEVFVAGNEKAKKITLSEKIWSEMILEGRDLIKKAAAVEIYKDDAFNEEDYRFFCGFDESGSPMVARALSARAGKYNKNSRVGVFLERIKRLAGIGL